MFVDVIAAQISEAQQPRVAVCPLGGSGVGELVELLNRRSIATQIATIADARGADVGAIAAVVRSRLSASMCIELGPLCHDAARAGRPVVLLASSGCFGSDLDRVTLSAYLHEHGALVEADPDVWLETVVLLAACGIPRGPNTALVLAPGGWLDDAAVALMAEGNSDRLAARRLDPENPVDPINANPTDIVLCETQLLPTQNTLDGVTVVPLCGRGELVAQGAPPTLVGLRAALRAANLVGGLRTRIDAGLAEADARTGPDDFDLARAKTQLDKLHKRAGDHETKVMLKAAGVAITRQAVATTASAAARLAKRAGFPVQMKVWGKDELDERSGARVETNLETAADVRRAFSSLCGTDGAAIVRETPPVGREMAVEIRTFGNLGEMMIVRVDGSAAPLAAVSPLSTFEANRLAWALSATRQGDAKLSHAEIADLLLRASFLFREFESLTALAMPRIVATAKEAIVVDAWATVDRARQTPQAK